MYLTGPKDIGIVPTDDQGTVSGRFFNDSVQCTGAFK